MLATVFFSGTYVATLFFWDFGATVFFFWDILFFSGTLRWATLATVFFSGTFGTVGSSGTGVTEGSVVEGIIAPVEFEV